MHLDLSDLPPGQESLLLRQEGAMGASCTSLHLCVPPLSPKLLSLLLAPTPVPGSALRGQNSSIPPASLTHRASPVNLALTF